MKTIQYSDLKEDDLSFPMGSNSSIIPKNSYIRLHFFQSVYVVHPHVAHFTCALTHGNTQRAHTYYICFCFNTEAIFESIPVE